MKIYFIRHAEAEDVGDDVARKLTPKGIRQSDKIGEFFKKTETDFDAIYSSPLVRAVQTAEVIASVVEPEKEPYIIQTQSLLNDATQGDFDSLIKSLLNVNSVMLVGHAPSLDERIRRLLGISNDLSFKMPKASVACIETIDGVIGILKYFISHKLL